VLGFFFVLLVCALLNDKRLWRPSTYFTISENVQIGEAQAWWNGRLDLPERKHDTALVSGKIYSHFPPLFTILAACIVPFFDGVPHIVLVILTALVPALAYVTFLRITNSVLWGVLFAVGLVCGTSAWPVLRSAVSGALPYQVNQTLAIIGLLMIACELFGSKRTWPAALGLVIAGLSRQMTVLFAPTLLYLAWRGEPGQARLIRLAIAGGACALVIGVHGTLNTLKFGHPFRTGYLLIYEGRDDGFAKDARDHGLFSWHWVPRNLYHANLGFPRAHQVTVAGKEEVYLRPDVLGTGIWWTSPVLLWIFVVAARRWSETSVAVPIACVAAVFGALLFFHATGAFQRGYNRFSLDYIPVMMALIAPTAVSGRRRWITVLMLAWGVVYFQFLLAIPLWHVWTGSPRM
jgi:hypothetical protein